MQAFRAIRAAVAKRIGNVIVFGLLYTGAEFIQQTVNNKILVPAGSSPRPYDTGSLARYAFMGTCVFPHTLHYAYRYLDRKFVGQTMKVVLPKLAADALTITPINLTLFYVGMSILERKRDIFEEWRNKIIITFVTASGFWVPASFINFRFLPPQFRVIFVGSCQIVWVFVLCWFKQREY